MLQCLACELCRDTLKKIKVFHLHWGGKNPENVSINISWCKIPNSAFQALHTSKIEDWMVGMCGQKRFLTDVARYRDSHGQFFWQEKMVVAEMSLMKVGCAMKSSAVSRAGKQTLCVGSVGRWGCRPEGSACGFPWTRSWCSGPQLRSWMFIRRHTFKRWEEPEAVGKQNVQSSPHPIGWTHLPCTRCWQECSGTHFHVQDLF